MRTTKNYGPGHPRAGSDGGSGNMRGFLLFLVLASLCLTACTPPGPRELLQGRDLLEAGNYQAAAGRLEVCVSILPTNAAAWNYLGLSYHRSHRPADAENAYRRALLLNHDLGEARYNLGCLLLEQNRLEAAKSELLAFTLRRGNSLDGLMMLGATQLRLKDFTGAEKSYGDALRINQDLPDAWNGLAMIRLQRGKTAEAWQYVNHALKLAPQNPQALLNSGLIASQYLKDRNTALDRFRTYVNLHPAPENADSIRVLIRQIEGEIAVPRNLPLPRPTPVTNNPAATLSTTSAVPPVVRQPPTNTPPIRPNPAIRSEMDPTMVKPQPPPTASHPTQQPTAPIPSPVPQPPAAPAPRTTLAAPPTNNPEPVRPAVAAPTKEASPPRPPSRIVDIPPAGQPSNSPPGSTIAPPPSPRVPDPVTASAQKPTHKKGFFEKLNPLKLLGGDGEKKQTKKVPTPIPPPPTAKNGSSSTPAAADSSPGSPQMGSRPPRPSEAEAIQAPPAKRYSYLKPARPIPGKNTEARPLYARANEERNARHLPEAVVLYRSALKLDPSLYEAHYNLALVLASTADPSGALAACETALAIRPDSTETRYAFALLLKDNGYLVDAAQEFERLLSDQPANVRAHLAAGNLYAQQLQQHARARSHYLKVLELDPHNANAGSIGYWLADHPL